MRRNSGIIGLKQSTSLTTASGKFDTYDQYNSRLGNVWPKVKKLVSISPNSGTHYEGEYKTYGVTVSGYENGDIIYYTIASVSGNVISSDFKSGFTGSIELNSSGYGTISLELWRDATSETESFKIQIRDGSTSGTIIGESGTFTIPDPSYTLTASNSSPNEGDTVTFTLTGTDAYAGTHYYMMGSTAGNSSDISSSVTGNYYYNGSTGSFSITITEDYLTEGSETLLAQARVQGTGGPVVASTTVTVNDTSQTVSATCTPDVSTVNEGSNVTFTVNTTNFTSGTLNWDTVRSADMESTDISATSGTVSISGSTGSIVITATADGYTETGQTESFQVRVYDPNGTVMVTSSSVTISDTSTGTTEPSGIFVDLINLASSLANATVPTPSNLQSIQSTIENANSAFNVFAVVGYTDYAESLAGTGVAGGKRTHTAKGFNYNTSSSNILSTGNTIANMTGGSSSNLSVIDGKKWMAMAQFDGTNFDGILLWIFTGDSVSNTGTVTSGARSVTNVRDIFYPAGTGSTNYHHFYPIAIDPSGTVTSNTASGSNGWNFSNNQQPVSTTGHYQTGRLAADDGAWGFKIPTGANTSYVDGNSPGTNFKSTSSTTPGFGMGNYDSSDSNSDTYWNGTNTMNTNNMGFVFSGDA